MTPIPHNEKAAAEIVGALILISIFCLVIAIIAVGIFSTPPPEKIPALSMQFVADPVTNTISIHHTGGDPIPEGQYRVMVGGTDVTQYVSNSGTSGNWALGNTLTVNDPYIVVTPDTRVEVVYTGGGRGTYLIATNGTVSSVVSGGPPNPDFTYSVRLNTLTVDFTDLTIGGTRPLTYDWDFGNGTPHSSSENPTETYGTEGIYSVTLSVRNSSDSHWVNVTKPVNIPHPIPPVPVASFSGSNTSGYAPLVVRFTDSSSGSPTNWSWTFGDGNTSFLQNPLNTYLVPATYSVSLTVTNDGGSNTATYMNYITVYPAPLPVVANFTATPISGFAPLLVQFTDSSTGPITSWSWTFGDGNTTTVQDPLYEYPDIGNYTVSLTVGNGTGFNTLTRTNYITVNPVTYTINATAGANGAIDPAGITTVISGANQTYNITPNTGYHVADVLVDDSSVGNVTTYQFTNVVANHTISATFAINTYTITASNGANGNVTPAGVTTVNYGGNQPYNITPITGYHVVDVLVDSSSVGNVTTYQFTNVTASHTISATFAIDTFTITASNGANGNVTPAGVTTVNYGGNQPYNITPITGYHIVDVLVDSSSVGNVTTYQFTNVTASHTISATFAINQYTITASSGANGNVTPAGVTTVNYGGNQAYNITPITGYHVVDVLVDSSSVGNVTTYQFTNVAANHTISATFAINTYTITASSGANGNVTPAGVTTVNHGGNQAYNITPITSYFVENVTVDGSLVGNVTTYQFTNVIASHTISATFKQRAPVTNFTGSPLSGGVPLSVTFTDTSTNLPTSWVWNFGDGNISTLQNPTNTYAVPGNYSVSLTATNSGGSNYTIKNGYILTYVAAVANFTGTPASGPRSLTVSFTDLSIGTPSVWNWQFGDIGVNTSTLQNPAHTYTQVGIYSVNLSVANAFSSSYLLRTNYINVTTPPPVARILPNTTSGLAPLAVLFRDISSGSPTSWVWNFGDGNTTTTRDATYTFNNPGSYNVSLTATNLGGSSTAYQMINVYPVVIANFTATPTTVVSSQSVQFNDTSTGSPTIWSWTFGDIGAGNTSTLQNPTHAYASSGTYTVSLTATNGGGSNTMTRTNYITVLNPPPAFGSINPTWGLTTGGTPVTITGTNLIGANAGGIYNVSIGGSAASINSVTATTITATTASHAAGTVDVVITTPNGTATGTNAYTYVATPAFGSIVPSTGPTAGGTPVTITGTNLIGATTSGIYNVSIGGTMLTNMTVVSDTKIVGSTLAHAAGVVNVVITTPNGTATGTNAYTYVNPPTITGISPASGLRASGTRVNITGTNLVGATSVTFGSNAATINTNTATTINMTAPAGSGTVTVTVTTPNGTATTSYNYFIIQIFTASTTWTVPTGVVGIDYIVVAGGGGGGGLGGGGGAGGVQTGTLTTGLTGSKTVTVGAGGAGGTTARASNGANSVFATITATGGGGGGTSSGTSGVATGANGGSGGGGARQRAGGTGTAGQGNNGGTGGGSTTPYEGGGGGGKSAAGSNAANNIGGNGGAGTDYSATFGTGFGVSGVVGGGGGGGATSGTAGGGGGGGGGAGAVGSGTPTIGTPNTGGGGGGSGQTATRGGTGGSGVVVINYY